MVAAGEATVETMRGLGLYLQEEMMTGTRR